MAVPKHRMSRANTHARRSTWKAKLTKLQTIRVNGHDLRIPRKLAKAYQSGLLQPED
ncbi:MAG: 50S ribosomal protein L32 [Actinomycetaceae bacterium]|nr:50S ribosomal protein L32 [Actinomycetaceae bacterium]MDY6082927.1 50S ribosomal protein L32 [Actinomycetaceae bacterium]